MAAAYHVSATDADAPFGRCGDANFANLGKQRGCAAPLSSFKETVCEDCQRKPPTTP